MGDYASLKVRIEPRSCWAGTSFARTCRGAAVIRACPVRRGDPGGRATPAGRLPKHLRQSRRRARLLSGGAQRRAVQAGLFDTAAVVTGLKADLGRVEVLNEAGLGHFSMAQQYRSEWILRDRMFTWKRGDELDLASCCRLPKPTEAIWKARYRRGEPACGSDRLGSTRHGSRYTLTIAFLSHPQPASVVDRPGVAGNRSAPSRSW